MYKTYFDPGYHLGRDAFLHILGDYGLLLRKRRRSCRTTNSLHHLPVYPNLIKEMEITSPVQVWVSDITYIRLKEGFCFLSVVTNAYTRQIIGLCVGSNLETKHSLNALYQACDKYTQEQLTGIIHHSDRGCQYASHAYTMELKKKGIRISMTENGDPKENAIAERVNGILKTELLKGYEFEDIQQVRQAVHQAVEFYNNRRPHRSLNMLTPRQAAEKTGKIHKRWVCYKDKYRIICDKG